MKKTHKMNIVVFKLVHRTFELQALDTCVAALSSADMVRRIYVPSSDGPRAPASASSSTLAPTAEPTSSPPSSSNSSLAPTAETKPSPPPTFLPTPGQCGNVSSYTNARFFLFLSLLLTDRDRKRDILVPLLRVAVAIVSVLLFFVPSLALSPCATSTTNQQLFAPTNANRFHRTKCTPHPALFSFSCSPITSLTYYFHPHPHPTPLLVNVLGVKISPRSLGATASCTGRPLKRTTRTGTGSGRSQILRKV